MSSEQIHIPRDTLIEGGRTKRPHLQAWAAHLLTNLADSVEHGPAHWIDIAGCMNNAALIEVFRGDLCAARSLCELQLRWLANLSHVHGLVAVGHLVPQPWVNLGRLRRIQGDYEGSLGHFSLLHTGQAKHRVYLGPITVDTGTWQDMVVTAAIRPFLEVVYVVESVKTFFAAKDYARALWFVKEARMVTSAGIAPVLDEFELIALSHLDRYLEAMAATEQTSWMQSSYSKLLRVTYRLALVAITSGVAPVRRLIVQLAERVLSGNFENPRDQRTLRYLSFFGALADAVGATDIAGHIYHLGRRASRRFEDVPLELEFLDQLLALGETGEVADRAHLARERKALLRDCLYTTLLQPRGLVPDHTMANNPVFVRLRDRLEAIADAPQRTTCRSSTNAAQCIAVAANSTASP